MDANVSQINATRPGSLSPLLGSPGEGQGETQHGARLPDSDGLSFSSSLTVLADGDHGQNDHGQNDHGQNDHGEEDDRQAEDNHDAHSLRAFKSPKLDASHERMLDDMAAPRRRFRVLRFWTLEMLSLAIAVGLLSTITVILNRLDGQPVAAAQWPLGIKKININSLVALLATLIRASIVVVVAAILGQTRWLWFQGPKPRALQDLQDFDRGSRGVLGSLGLLWTVLRSGVVPTTSWTLSLLGVAVTVLSLTVSFVTQQAANTVNCSMLVPGQQASLPVAYRITSTDRYIWVVAEEDWFAPELKAAMINGLTSQMANFAPGIATHCPTGNCTFARDENDVTHASMGLCSQCVDTSKFATIHHRVHTNPHYNKLSEENRLATEIDNITLPGLNGSLTPSLFDEWGLPWPSVTWMTVGVANAPTSDIVPRDIAAVSLVNVSILALTKAPCQGEVECPRDISFDYGVSNPSLPPSLVAASCSLYPCLRSYSAEFQSGTLYETLVSVKPARGPFTTTGDPTPNEDEYEVYSMGGELCENSTRECLYQVRKIYTNVIQAYMQTLFNGHCSAMEEKGPDVNMVTCFENYWLQPLWNDGLATTKSISAVMDNLTDAVTNLWRATGDGPVKNGTALVWNRTGAIVYGDVWQTTVCLEFDWPWLLLPAALIAIVAIMLVLIIASSEMDQSWPVWKENILPLVLYGGIRGGEDGSDDDACTVRPTAHGADGDQHRDLMDLSRMEDEAKDTMVVFRRDPSPGFVVAVGK